MLADALVTAPASAPKDTLGCQSSQLRKDIEIDSGDIALYRKCMDQADVHRVAMPASERGFLIGISLTGGHQRDIFHGGRTIARRFETDSIYIRDFSEDYQADLHGKFDFVLVELSRAFFSRLGDEAGGPRIDGLLCGTDPRDAVLGHLACALAEQLETRGALGGLFAEQMGLVIGTHIAQRYGNLRTDSDRARGSLAPAQVARAKDLLMEKSKDGVSIADVASECNLSRGYFIRAFSKTTGRTPHQWLLEQRIVQAQELIKATALTLSDIAIYCGFADQSHLSRVFLRVVGTSPGAWRRSVAR